MPQLVTFYTQTCTKRLEAHCCGESVAMFFPFQLCLFISVSLLTAVLDCPNSRFVAHERPYVPTSTRRFSTVLLYVVTHQKRSTPNRCQCLSFFHHTNRTVSCCCTSLPATAGRVYNTLAGFTISAVDVELCCWPPRSRRVELDSGRKGTTPVDLT